jgi:hypothetical protein
MHDVRHGAQRLETPDGQRRGSHQDDQADCSVDGRTNNSNAEMMINATASYRTFFFISPSLIITAAILEEKTRKR